MPTILTQLRAAFRDAIRTAFNTDADPVLVCATHEKFGDYQCNAAMSLAKQLKLKPRDVAEKIRDSVDLGGAADKLEIAGPGFINIFLSPKWVESRLNAVAADDRLGVERKSDVQTVVVDYSGPNIAKEMHVGHLRSTIIGDAASRVLEFLGDRVIRQNHIGDWGTQFGRVILATWYICMAEKRHRDAEHFLRFAKTLETQVKRYKNAQSAGAGNVKTSEQNQELEASRMALAASLNWLGERHRSDYELDPKGVTYFVPFIHEYVPDLAKLLPFYQLVGLFDGLDLAAQIEVGGTSTLASLPRHITAMLQRGQRADYQELEMWWKVREATLNQCHDLYERLDVRLTRKDEYGESRYNPLLPRIVQDLLRAGVAVKSDGATAIFADGLDRSPLLIEKADEGGYLYGTTDIAAIWYRTFGIGARRIIYFVDARQASHFNLLFKAVRMAGWDCGAELQHAAFGTMLGKDNKPFKTRSGDTVKLKDLLDEAEERAYPLVADKNADLPDDQKREVARAVGIGAVKYSDLSKDRTSDYVFDWDSALALTGNSAPYLQYAHARICAIFRKAGVTASVDTSVSLEAPEEVALSKHILRLGEALDTVAVELKPHVLCAYLYDLATRFSAFYENCPVLKSEEPTRSSRLALCALTARTLALGLDLLGIKHPDQM